jgi:MFS family permease
LLFVIGGIIAVIAATARFALPESPRWLVLRGRNVEANEVVTNMEKVAERKLSSPLEPPVQLVRPQQVAKNAFPTKYLFKRPYSIRLAMLVFMWFFWYIGNYGFLGDAATLLSSQGITTANSIEYLALGAAGYPIGAIVMILIADKLERRYLILGSTTIWLVGMLLLGSLASNEAIALGALLASLALGMYLQVAYTFTAERFPTRARTSGFALCDGLGHIGGAFGALFLPVLVVSSSFSFGFGFIGFTGLLAGLISLAGPSVSRRDL